MAERDRRQQSNQPPFARQERRAAQQQETLRTWNKRIEHARQLRRTWATAFSVNELAALYRGRQRTWNTWETDFSQVNINRFWPTIKAMVPGLLSQAPTYHVAASSRSASQLQHNQAQMAENLLASIAKQDGHLVRVGQLALQQAFFRIGVLKATFDPRTERNPQRGQPQFLTRADGMPVVDEITGQPVPLLDPQSGQPLEEPSEITRDEIYRWDWVNASNMLFPDAGPDPSKWPWIGEEITVPLEDAKDDRRFPKALRDQLQPSSRAHRPDEDETIVHADILATLPDTPEEEITYCEIWDCKAKRRRIFAEGQTFSATSWLLDEDLPAGVEDHPYALLLFNPQTDPTPSPWPIPVTWNWMDLQHEYNVRRRQMINAARRSARKIGYEESTFPDADEAISALQSAVDMEAVKLTDINRPWITLADPPSTADITRDLLVLTQDWREVTGQTGARLSRPDSDTATEAIFAERASNLRDVDMRATVQNWLAEAGRKMLQLVKATLTLGTYVKIRGMNDLEFQTYISATYGPQALRLMQFSPALREAFVRRFGQEQWVRVTREDLQFEADVTVTPGSARQRTLDMERQQFLAFLQVLARFPQLALSRGLLRTVGDLFEFVDDSAIDEMHLLARQMAQAQAQAQAGRQGGAPQSPQGIPLSGASVPQQVGALQAALLQAASLGNRGR